MKEKIISRAGQPLSDITLREAISYAINRDVVAQIVGNGYAQAIYGPFPESANYGFNQIQGQSYDVDKSRELLAQGGYIDTDNDGYVELKDGSIAEFTMEFEVNIIGTAMPEAIQDMLRQVGIKLVLNPVESSSYNPDDHLETDFNIDAAFPVNVGDGQKFLTNGFTTGGSENYGGFSNPEYDELMVTLANTFDQQERMNIFIEAQQFLIDEIANVWLYAPDDITIISDKMTGVDIHPLNYYLVTMDWDVTN
ncbi:MAG: hypothetical protein BEN19_08795 [Epulopiscium sp. Nuni2H_MBin003]|nr:MAG: hypothetical protein BEN19_08795 [Epulopiscium sp. Nuni2H_MBin003]